MRAGTAFAFREADIKRTAGSRREMRPGEAGALHPVASPFRRHRGFGPAAWALTIAASVMLASPTLAQDFGAAEVSLNRGISAFTGEDYDAARRHFEAATAQEPEFAAAHYFLGLTLLQSATEVDAGPARTAVVERALAELDHARLRDPQMVLAYLDAAIAQTILGRFNEAESGFQKFIEERPNDPLPYLFLAVIYYRQAREDGQYLPSALENLDAASAALARGERPDRSLEAQIKFYRGLVLLEQKDASGARASFEEVAELEPESDIGQQSQVLVDKLVERRPWELSLQMGFDYDTNVILRGHNVRPRLRDGNNDDEDWRFGLGSAFTYRLVDEENLLVGTGFNTFHSWHGSIHDYNIQNYGANVFASFSPPEAEWLTATLRYDFDYTLAGNESFLARHRITPQLDIEETNWTRSTLFYQWDIRNYHNQPLDWRLDRDGDTHAMGVVQHFDVFEMYERFVTVDLSYRFEDVQTDGTEFESDNHIFALALGVPLPWDMTFDMIHEFEVDYYRNSSLFDLTRRRRQDFIHTMIFALTKKFNENLSARFQIDVTDADSNVVGQWEQEYFTYSRVVYGFTVIYQF